MVQFSKVNIVTSPDMVGGRSGGVVEWWGGGLEVPSCLERIVCIVQFPNIGRTERGFAPCDCVLHMMIL